MSSQPDTNPLTPGAVVLDRYRVVEHVAAGGHSVVYRGQDERLSRPVCIKVFSRLPSEHGVSRASYEHFVQGNSQSIHSRETRDDDPIADGVLNQERWALVQLHCKKLLSGLFGADGDFG